MRWVRVGTVELQLQVEPGIDCQRVVPGPLNSGSRRGPGPWSVAPGGSPGPSLLWTCTCGPQS